MHTVGQYVYAYESLKGGFYIDDWLAKDFVPEDQNLQEGKKQTKKKLYSIYWSIYPEGICGM